MRMRIGLNLFAIAAFITAVIALPPITAAEVLVGVRGGVYEDKDAEDSNLLLAGAELVAPLGGKWWVNPNAEHRFDDTANVNTFSLDFHRDIDTASSLFLWLGGGPSLVHTNPDGPADAHSDVGGNALFGVGVKSKDVVPYMQAKALFLDEDNVLSLAAGIRF
ncbi:MAG: hypothetical protein HYV63_16265 [Candidatus Schekmanbacteria bacterium]|nr:hypothetical protein [Candidatus Schekmanbacteria bacterium]